MTSKPVTGIRLSKDGKTISKKPPRMVAGRSLAKKHKVERLEKAWKGKSK